MVFFAIVFVLIAEAVNTAIEVTIDLITKDYHPLAAVAKTYGRYGSARRG